MEYSKLIATTFVCFGTLIFCEMNSFAAVNCTGKIENGTEISFSTDDKTGKLTFEDGSETSIDFDCVKTFKSWNCKEKESNSEHSYEVVIKTQASSSAGPHGGIIPGFMLTNLPAGGSLSNLGSLLSKLDCK